ncbi:MAG: NTP transferase domain-containing protein [Proteobacteria bacterium]|nr:NTP transferase domain-containing protein [Pseudomonadota bacterium]MBU1059642.1 NTP transferase domain-containing protein [Pseudomonadota bacterium]
MTHATLSLVLLAAGKGTRMKSNKAKVLHELFYAPMLHHVLHAVSPLQAEKTVVVVGHQKEAVEESLAGFSVDTVVQKEQLGTGHAVLCSKPVLAEMKGTIMILCGDTPLIRSETLQAMLTAHTQCEAVLTVMTTILDNPSHYGRIICDNEGMVLSIVEEKDANPREKKIQEINAGIYCVDAEFLFSHLLAIGTDNSQGEIYLTDIVSLAVEDGHPVHKFINPVPQDVLGVNSRVELAEAQRELQLRRNRVLMLNGVGMISPETTLVSPQTTIDQDVTLHPGVQLSGESTISTGCVIETGALLHNVTLAADCRIGAYSCLNGCSLQPKSIIPPHTSSCS